MRTKLAIALGITLFLTLFSGAQRAAAQQPPSPPSEPAPAVSPPQGSTPAPPTLTVSGSVHAANNISVPGATIRVIETSSGRAWITWTDESGHFTLPGLAPGHYRVEVAQLGFENAIKEFDLTSSGVPAPLDLPLKVADLANIAETGQLSQPASAAAAPKPPVNSATTPTNSNTAGVNPNAPTGRGGAGPGGRGGFGNGRFRNQQAGQQNGQGEQGPGAQGGRGFNQVRLNGQQDQQQTEPTAEEPEPPGNEQASLGQAPSSDAFLLSGTVAQGTDTTGNGAGFGGGFGGGPGGPGFDAGANPAAGAGGAQHLDQQPAPDQADLAVVQAGAEALVAVRAAVVDQAPARIFAVVEAEVAGGRGGRGGQGRPQGAAALYGAQRIARQRANQVHVSLYDQYGNSAFDARPYSLTGVNPPKIPTWNERFGGNVGGPVRIPHIYDGSDTTFFYINYEPPGRATPWTQFSTVPTQFERQNIGNFCDLPTAPSLYVPTNTRSAVRRSHQRRLRPALRLDKSRRAGALPELFPGAQSRRASWTIIICRNAVPTQTNRLNTRVLQTISPKLNARIIYNFSQGANHAFQNFPGHRKQHKHARPIGHLGLTQNFTSTWINDTQLIFSRNRDPESSTTSASQNNVAAALGHHRRLHAPLDWGLPQLGFTNYSGLAASTPSLTRNQTYRFVDAFTNTRPKHTIHIRHGSSPHRKQHALRPHARRPVQLHQSDDRRISLASGTASPAPAWISLLSCWACRPPPICVSAR